jgi:hypothetical protein
VRASDQYVVGGAPESSGGGTGHADVFDLKQVLVALSQHCTEPDSEGHVLWQSESSVHVGAHCGAGGGAGGGAVAVPSPDGIVDGGGGSVASASPPTGPGSDVAHATRSAARERHWKVRLAMRTGMDGTLGAASKSPRLAGISVTSGKILG